MADEEDEPEIQEMWATVVEITPQGIVVQLDDDQEHGQSLIPKFWSKTLGFNMATITVGARMRCGVQIEWKPTYFVRRIHNIVHEGGKLACPKD